MRINFYILFSILLFLSTHNKIWADGTRNFISPSNTSDNNAGVCLFNAADGNYKIGTVEATSNAERFFVHVADPINEQIYFGFQMGFTGSNNNRYFRVKAPDGTIVLNYTRIPTATGVGYVDNFTQVFDGPAPTVTTGGYNPIVVTPDPTQPGDYIIEFNTVNYGNTVVPTPTGHNYSTIFRIFDVSMGKDVADVGSKTHELVEGRFFAYIIPMYNFLNKTGLNNAGIDVSYFIYHEADQVTTKLIWNDVVCGGFNVLFNSTGPGSGTNLIERRKSLTQAESSSAVVLPEHRIFYAKPDIDIYIPTEVPPEFNYEDYRKDCATGSNAFFFSVNRSGRLEILIEFDDPHRNGVYEPGTSDRLLFVEDVTINRNAAPWDGLDGLGVDRSEDSIFYNINFQFSIGAMNNPMYDVERVLGGLAVELIAPDPSPLGWPVAPKIYWDDSKLSPLLYNYSGCGSSACHTYNQLAGQDLGESKWMNSWWNAYETDNNETFYAANKLGYVPIDTIYGVEPTECSTNDGFVVIEGLIGNKVYKVSYKKDGTLVPEADYTANYYGKIIIPNLGPGDYSEVTVSQGTPPSCINTYGFTIFLDCPPFNNNATLPCTNNPGGTVNVSVASSYFTGTSFQGNIIDSIRFVAFPPNATSITIGGNTYTSATFPSNGVKVATNAIGNPAVAIAIDPKDNINNAKIYFAVTDDKGLESSYYGEITVPFNNMLLSTYITNASNCGTSSGEINLNVGYGNAPYSYLWSPGGQTIEDITNLTAGTYSVVVTDNLGCQTNTSATVAALPISGTCNMTVEAPPAGGAGNITGANGSLAITQSTPGTAWTSLGNITNSDNLLTSVDLGNHAYSNTINISNFNFSSIPANATINGIVVSLVKTSSGSGRIRDEIIQITKNGSVVGIDNKADTGTNWPTSLTTTTYGGSSDLWGVTWNVSDLSNIGLNIRVYNNRNRTGTASIDNVTITVYYNYASNYLDNGSYSFSIDPYDQATTYLWTVTNGATVSAGQGTTNATIDFNNMGAGSYTICATPSNSCETVAPCCTTITVVEGAGPLVITGNVYNDFDGAAGTNKVDGTGIGSVDGTQLYATLVDTADNRSDQTVAVASDGTYRFTTVAAGLSYKVVLSTTNYANNTLNPTASLPSDWYFVGEIDNNAANSLTGYASDSGNLVMPVNLVTGGNGNSNMNFGILKAPACNITCAASVDLGCNPILADFTETAPIESCPYWEITSWTSTLNAEPAGSCNKSRTRTYNATLKLFGIFGNQTSSCDQTYTFIRDTQGPTITGSPMNTVIEGCTLSEVPPAKTTIAGLESLAGLTNIADNCTADCGLFVSSSQVVAGTCPIVVTRTYVITDGCGNSTNLVHTIQVDDTTNPTATAPANVNVVCISDIPAPNTALITDEVDNCTTTPLVTFINDANNGGLGSAASPYVVTRTYRVSDDCGNSIDLIQTLTASDAIPPSITCPSNIVVSNDAGVCGAIVNYPAPVVTDNCSGATTTRTSGLASGSLFPVGTNTVTYTASDAAGNTDVCSFTVTVTDTEAPVATLCPSNVSGLCSATYDPVDPTFTDNCGITDITWAMSGATNDASPISGINYIGSYVFNEGTTTVTYTAKDAAGNSTLCSFDITFLPPHLAATVVQPSACGANGTINLTFTNVPDNSYTITYDAGTFTNVAVSGGTASISATPGTYNNLYITVNTCSSSEDVDVIINDPSCFDYGDAPVSYDGGSAARHILNAVPAFYIGIVAPDSELSAFNSVKADGDNVNGIDDEDAFVFFPPYTTLRTSYTLHVPVTNSSGGDVELAAWIDIDGNGTFDNSERASVTVSNLQDTATLVWNSLPILTDGLSTYIRIRMASNAADVANATGTASDGEVEDYPFQIFFAGECPSEAYLVQDGVGNWFEVNLGEGTYTAGNDNLSVDVNAVGFNTIDGLVYGISNLAVSADAYLYITSLDPNNSVPYFSVNLGKISGLVPNAHVNTGDVGNGVYYVRVGGQNLLYSINVDPASKNYLKEAKTTALTGVTGSYTDMVYLPSDNQLYSLDNSTGNLHTIDPITGIVSVVATAVVPPGTYGAQYLDVNGFLYASENNNGNIYRISLSGNPNYNGLLFSVGPRSTLNDGSRCPFAPVPNDYGDAPQSYKDEVSPGVFEGASHGVPLYNSITHTAPLMLGANVDTEYDSFESALANADDLDAFDDEEAMASFPSLNSSLSSYSISVPVLNNTGGTVYLSGYIDFDNNGKFDADERADANLTTSALTSQ